MDLPKQVYTTTLRDFCKRQVRAIKATTLVLLRQSSLYVLKNCAIRILLSATRYFPFVIQCSMSRSNFIKLNVEKEDFDMFYGLV